MTSDVATGRVFFNDSAGKYWKHRVNTIEDIKKYRTNYTGFELDVVYYPNENEFRVEHESNSSDRLLLVDYFDAFTDINRFYFWIDIKNLNEGNILKLTNKLVSILKAYNIENRTICESFYPSKLTVLNNNGLNTSYWLPYIDYNGTLTKKQKEALNIIKRNLQECPHNAISAPYTMLPFIERYLPDCTVHLWTNGLYGESDKHLIREIAAKSQVKILLIDYNTPL